MSFGRGLSLGFNATSLIKRLYTGSSLPFLNMPNYPNYKELTEEIDSPTAISLGLAEQGQPVRLRCYNCGQMGHISYDCKFPQVRKACYTCGNQGHLSRDCPQKKKVLVCYSCRQVGHITVDCPNKKPASNNPTTETKSSPSFIDNLSQATKDSE